MLRRPLLLAAFGLAVLAPPAAAADYVPGEVIVRYAGDAGRAERAATQRATGVGAPRAFAPRTRVLRIRDGQSVAATVAELRRRPGVATAVPNYLARASFYPADPGNTGRPGGWQSLQWNFLPGPGVNAPLAWDNVLRVGRPGGRGVTVAVLDTGVAYADRGRFRRSPDLGGPRFKRGFDFVDNDPYPNDANGHGTHVASTIAENINNGVGVTGLAYGAKIMPVRVLNGAGIGDVAVIARGIRYAAAHGAQIINLSFELAQRVVAYEIPDLLAALRYARRKGVLVVGSSGNEASGIVAYPARADDVLSVGATTEHGCLAEYSNGGVGLDLVAPGGGPDADLPGQPNCRPNSPRGRDIVQMTFESSVRRFGLPAGYKGTSMAAPHVSAAAALVIASGVLGPAPAPSAVEERLKATAHDLGAPGPDDLYGAGLVDAGAATTPPAG
jgi:serine protease